MSTSSSVKTLTKILSTPAKIASTLDWKKAAGASIMSIDIHKDRIGLAISGHPSVYDHQSALTTMELSHHTKGQRTNNNNNNVECQERISQLIKDYNVCGFVVSFPLQQDTGRMGAACGRTLHTLESLLSDSNIVTPNRPLCLWDSLHSSNKAQPEDRWGRSSGYCFKNNIDNNSRTSSDDPMSTTTKKTIHIASQEQYNQDENIVAAQVWDDFCRVNWPNLCHHDETTTTKVNDSSTIPEVSSYGVKAEEEEEEEQQYDDETAAASAYRRAKRVALVQ